MSKIEIRHFHLFCGLGGGAKGFNQGEVRVGSMVARFRCLGGIDVDPASCRDFARAADAPATCIDLFSREQFTAFHGREPAGDWREASPADIANAAGGERPHIVFLSAPCKGFSGLLAETASRSPKYQALNGLTLRGVWLMLEAWKGDPPELVIFENVPRIMKRGRHLLDQIVALLKSYGYAVAETAHDCGEIGGLAQSRKRFLLVARHVEKVPPFLYEPVRRPLRGVGEVIGRFPVPGPETVLPMHRMPSLQWKTWVRLAFVEAGSDWRSLNRLRVEDGHLADYGIAAEPDRHNGAYGVQDWSEPAGTVTANGRPGSGTFSVADPRVDGHPKSVQLGVRPWDRPSGVVTSKMIAGGGPNAVADPRVPGTPYNHVYRIVDWGEPGPAVTSANGGTAAAVADPRQSPRADYKQTKYRITGFDEPSGAVIAASTTGNGAYAVADPRPARPPEELHGKFHITPFDQPSRAVIGGRENGAFVVADPRPVGLNAHREAYMTGGHYGVVPWQDPAGAVPAFAKCDRGRWSVADPRPAAGEALPAPNDRLVAVIRALDGSWHRPFTTLELAALQGLVEPEETLELDGLSDSGWRERIGNAVPPPAAKAIAGVMARTLLLAWSGETFMLSAEPIWVRPVAAALSVAQEGQAE